ncbi:PQQ-binding-like beta-propeller repeat protein [bacterium]|nr:PQQ-binding-like beta-propeller repeat protein [bacterium]
MNVKNPLIAVCLSASLMLITGCGSGDRPFTDEWPQYRGPRGDGVSSSAVSITPWKEGALPHEVWKQPIGVGFSGITLAGEQLLVAFGADSSEYLGAYDRRTGAENWRCAIGPLFTEELGDGPRATAAVAGDLAYIYNSWGHLYSVNIQTGAVAWRVALADTFNVPMLEPKRGFTNSPIVVDDKVIMYAGGNDSTAFIAFDRLTGDVVWRTGSTRGSYSSPIVATIDGVKQILFTTTRVIQENGRMRGVYEVFSVSPEGDILWTGPGVGGVIAMPVFVPPNRVFVSSQIEDIGSKLIEVTHDGGRWSASEVWKSSMLHTHFNTAVYYEGYLYGFSNATLECLDAATAERKWRKRGLGKGSLMIADGKLIMLTDRGKLALAKATSEGYEELASADVIEGKSWTVPTYADGMLYLRNVKEMACYDLTK